MIFISVGLPGRFGQWCDLVVAQLAGYSSARVTVKSWPPAADMFGYDVIAPTLDQAAFTLLSGDIEHLVVGVKQPDAGLLSALAHTGARFVVALDHPRSAAAEILAETEADVRAVTRAVANSCARLIPYPSLPGALLVHADSTRVNTAGTVLAIAGHLGIGGSDVEIARIVERLPETCDFWPTTAQPVPVPDTASRLMDGAFAGYEECFAGRGLGAIVWAREMFIVNGPNTPPIEPFDITGSARILVYGPYIHLPPGPWLARVHIGVSHEASKCTFLIDAYSDGELASVSLQPARGGAYVTDFNFFLSESRGQGVEIRLTVLNNDASGQLAFGNVRLMPLTTRTDSVTELNDDFTAVLRL
ncbi:MAG: hypothetical protein JO358_02530 [Alphaproteobacteria bacterium]|nr:hypothetical protein [Alphaproteobacteria bacterium]